MDPNELYRRFLGESQEADRSERRGHKEAQRWHLENANNAASDLFDWLAKDGFAPEWRAVAEQLFGTVAEHS